MGSHNVGDKFEIIAAGGQQRGQGDNREPLVVGSVVEFQKVSTFGTDITGCVCCWDGADGYPRTAIFNFVALQKCSDQSRDVFKEN